FMLGIFRAKQLKPGIESVVFQHPDSFYVFHHTLVGDKAGYHQESELRIPRVVHEGKPCQVYARAGHQVGVGGPDQLAVNEQVEVVRVLKEYLMGEAEANAIEEDSD